MHRSEYDGQQAGWQLLALVNSLIILESGAFLGYFVVPASQLKVYHVSSGRGRAVDNQVVIMKDVDNQRITSCGIFCLQTVLSEISKLNKRPIQPYFPSNYS